MPENETNGGYATRLELTNAVARLAVILSAHLEDVAAAIVDINQRVGQPTELLILPVFVDDLGISSCGLVEYDSSVATVEGVDEGVYNGLYGEGRDTIDEDVRPAVVFVEAPVIVEEVAVAVEEVTVVDTAVTV